MSQRNTRPNIKWTEAEENILLECIGENPTNLSACFLAASRRLPVRTASACSSHWYTKMAGDDNVIGKLTIGRSSVVKNKVRLNEKSTATHKKSIVRGVWQAIINTIFGL